MLHCVWLRSSARINIRINSCDENPLVKPHAIAKSLLAVASRLNNRPLHEPTVPPDSLTTFSSSLRLSAKVPIAESGWEYMRGSHCIASWNSMFRLPNTSSGSGTQTTVAAGDEVLLSSTSSDEIFFHPTIRQVDKRRQQILIAILWFITGYNAFSVALY